MRKLFLLPFLILTIGLLQAQTWYYPLPEGKKEFKINEQAGIKIRYAYQIVEGVKVPVNIIEYGNKGLPAVMYEKGIDENGDSVTTDEKVYKYNSNLAIEKITSSSGYDEGDNSVTSFSYDSKGRLIKKEIADIDPPVYYYKYDAKGRLSSVNYFNVMPETDDKGEYTGKTFERPVALYTYKYDEKNRLISEFTYEPDSKQTADDILYKIEWKYDSQNRIIQITEVNSGGDSETLITRLEYNKQDLLSKLTRITPDGEEDVYVYEYCTTCKQSWMQ
ncbi:MAG: hypothetical protein H6549_13790 [Chitinophagales bacterium]|nr:hypothetical protein [Chitinophagales bacterium]